MEDFNKKHPEIRKGEMFLTNICHCGLEPDWEKKMSINGGVISSEVRNGVRSCRRLPSPESAIF